MNPSNDQIQETNRNKLNSMLPDVAVASGICGILERGSTTKVYVVLEHD